MLFFGHGCDISGTVGSAMGFTVAAFGYHLERLQLTYCFTCRLPWA